MFYLNRIPFRSSKIVDLEDEVILYSFQPLNSKTFVRHPGNRGQVVLTEGKKEIHYGSPSV